jgi:hypothetical protein
MISGDGHRRRVARRRGERETKPQTLDTYLALLGYRAVIAISKIDLVPLSKREKSQTEPQTARSLRSTLPPVMTSRIKARHRPWSFRLKGSLYSTARSDVPFLPIDRVQSRRLDLS